MKSFYQLCNFELSKIMKDLFVFCLAVILIPALMLSSTMNGRLYERFETLYELSGSLLIFALFALALCGLIIKNFYGYYWGSKSVYTLLTLPVRREAIYWSQLVAFISSLLTLFASQLLSLLLYYEIYRSKLVNWEAIDFKMHNTLFLALLRSESLQLLFPVHPVGILSTISIVLTITTAIFYGMICERSGRIWGLFIIVPALFLLIRVIVYRLAEPSYYGSGPNLLIYSVLLLGLSGWYVWYSLYLIKRGAIA